MVFDDLLEDMFEREDKTRKRKRDEEDNRDERKRKYDEENDEEDYDKRGKKRGFFDRISELFD